MKPSDLRRTLQAQIDSDSYEFRLGYRPPFDWSAILDFLQARAILGVEHVDHTQYSRSVVLKINNSTEMGWVQVRNDEDRSCLRVRVAGTLSHAIPIVLTKLKTLFDLSCQPTQIDDALQGAIPYVSGLRVPGSFDGFETAARAILGQQISVKAATTLAGRLVSRFGIPIETPMQFVTHAFPTAAVIASLNPEQLVSIGVTSSRAQSILALAAAMSTGQLRLDAAQNVSEAIKTLKTLPGVGEWTAQYIAMRALSWPDAFPHTDLGIRNALGISSVKRILEVAEAWRPWRAYATINLWHSLRKQSGTTKS